MCTIDDAKVLNAILNPNTPFEEEEAPKKNESTYEQSAAINEAKEHEIAGVRAAEANDLKASIKCFNKAIEVAPHWASAYNNRAQCLRLLTDDVEGALRDLDTAIDLAAKYNDSRVTGLAYAQKGTILRLKENNTEALECFKKSAELGNKFAKQQCISLNPYAAMCNKMLTGLFDKVQKGQA